MEQYGQDRKESGLFRVILWRADDRTASLARCVAVASVALDVSSLPPLGNLPMSGWSRTGAKVAPSRQRWDTPANASALIFSDLLL